ncbi:hypothetical protein TNCV_2534461 [Trichonephila clavipes]|nr:hypothetical protein TNCV_2534461 [Trichonephila clavipes]
MTPRLPQPFRRRNQTTNPLKTNDFEEQRKLPSLFPVEENARLFIFLRRRGREKILVAIVLSAIFTGGGDQKAPFINPLPLMRSIKVNGDRCHRHKFTPDA